MRRIYIQDNWPESWKSSYVYDLEEVYGEISNLGYAYAYQNRRGCTLKMVSEVLPQGARVLDIAAAQGNFSLALAEMGYDVTWNDLRAELVDYVRMKHETGKLSFAPGNAFELNFPHLFDAVLISEVIEHVAHPDEFLSKVSALIKPGGYMIMTTPNGAYFRNTLPKFSECPDPSVFEATQFGPNSDDHIFLLHTDEVWSFARRADLIVDRFALLTNPLTAGHVKLGFMLKALPKHVVDNIEKLSLHMPIFMAERLFTQMCVRFQKPAQVI